MTSPILGAGDGLSGSHNKFESDASVSRGGKSHTMTERDSLRQLLIVEADYYLYNGDVSVSTRLYQLCQVLVAYVLPVEPGTSKIQSVVRTTKYFCSPELRPEYAVRLPLIQICVVQSTNSPVAYNIESIPSKTL